MGEYDNLDSLVGKLKRSAIDALMVSAKFEITELGYVQSMGTSGYLLVTRPNSAGEGGGEYRGILDASSIETLLEAFQTTRDSIDDAMAPWFDIPHPQAITSIVDSCVSVVSRFSNGTGLEIDGQPVTEGVASSNIRGIEQNIAEMNGLLFSAFKETFLRRLSSQLQGLYSISFVCTQNVAAQREIWQRARNDIVEIVRACQESFDLVSQNQPNTYEMFFTVVGSAASGASSLIPGAGIIAGMAGIGEAIAEEDNNNRSKALARANFDSFESGMKEFFGLLDELQKHVTNEEIAVQFDYLRLHRTVRRNEGNFDLDPDAITVEEVDEAQAAPDARERLDFGQAQVDEITGYQMPMVHSELIAASNLIWPCNTYQVLSRDARVGIGVTGPSREHSEVLDLLFELTRELAWEVEVGGKHLAAGVEYINTQDQSAKEDFDKYSDALASGSPISAWD